MPLKTEADQIRYLLDSHKKIEDRVSYYLELTNDLLHDCDIITGDQTELFYVVDFSVVFEKLFPLLTSRGRESSHGPTLINSLRSSLAEKILINFFFKTCPKKVLLKVYAEEYGNFYTSHKTSILRLALLDKQARIELLDKLAEEYCFFAIWRQHLPISPSSDEMENVIRYFGDVLDEGQDVFASLVDKRSGDRLLPLADALEGAVLKKVSVKEFEPLRDEIKGRSISQIEDDITALSIVKALNQQFGQDAGPLQKLESIIRSKKVKRFVFVTKDSQILTAVRSLPLDVTLPKLSNGKAENVSFCRSLDHFLLLYLCSEKTQSNAGFNAGEVKMELLRQRDNIEDYLQTINEAENWLKEKNQELQNPKLRHTLESRWSEAAKTQPADPTRLQEKIDSFKKSREFKNIMRFDYRSLLTATAVSPEGYEIPEIKSKDDFAEATKRIKTVVPRLEIKEGNPFLHLEQVRKRLDVIIALFDTPVWNRYTGFNYPSPEFKDHPLAEQLNKIATLLAERTPVKNAEALEKLFSLVDEDTRKATEKKQKPFPFITDVYYNACLSKAYRVQGRYYKSIRVCERTLFLRSDKEDSKELRFEQGLSLKFLGRNYMNEDSKELARKFFEKAYEQDPSDARFVHELAVAEWGPVEKQTKELRGDAEKIMSRYLFYSHPATVNLIKKNMNKIEHARSLVAKWLNSEAQNLARKGEWSNEKKALFVMISNAHAYFKWVLALQSKDALESDIELIADTEAKFVDALNIAKDAYAVYEKVDNQKLAESVRLHILETLIQIRLSLCEISALKGTINTDFLEALESNFSEFVCTPEFEGCYHNIHDEYSKFRRIYHVYRLVQSRPGQAVGH